MFYFVLKLFWRLNHLKRINEKMCSRDINLNHNIYLDSFVRSIGYHISSRKVKNKKNKKTFMILGYMGYNTKRLFLIT